MKKSILFLLLLSPFFACTKSTVEKYGCAEPPLAGVICIPNIFTPNGDGINDVLYVRTSPGLAQIDTMQFRVMDGAGSNLFVSTLPAIGWDGTYNNGKKKTGVYSWEIKATLSSGEEVEYSGTVTLLEDGISDFTVSNCAECRFDAQFNGNGGFNETLPSGEPGSLCGEE
jgi:gliding motility-associated-like protein